jgi:hypothetical protein
VKGVWTWSDRWERPAGVYVLFGLTISISGTWVATTLTSITVYTLASLKPRYVVFMSHNLVHPGEYLHGTKGLAISAFRTIAILVYDSSGEHLLWFVSHLDSFIVSMKGVFFLDLLPLGLLPIRCYEQYTQCTRRDLSESIIFVYVPFLTYYCNLRIYLLTHDPSLSFFQLRILPNARQALSTSFSAPALSLLQINYTIHKPHSRVTSTRYIHSKAFIGLSLKFEAKTLKVVD